MKNVPEAERTVERNNGRTCGMMRVWGGVDSVCRRPDSRTQLSAAGIERRLVAQ
jgi:hypothetical protein